MYSDLGQSMRTVSDDLSAIFPAIPPTVGEPSGGAGPAVQPPRSGARWGWPTLGLILATGLVGVAAGALVVPLLLNGRSDAREPTAAPPQVAAAVLASPAPVPQAVIEASRPTADPMAVIPKMAVVPKRIAKAFPVRRPAASAPSAMARCARVDRRDRPACAHAVMLAQDRSLRRAYAQAVRAGVSRDTLADSTRRWATLRRQAISQPARAAAGYAALGRDLSREASVRARGHGRRG